MACVLLLLPVSPGHGSRELPFRGCPSPEGGGSDDSPPLFLRRTLVLNLFNHQTHHGRQATTLLFQAGVDIGVTDLLALVPEEAAPTAKV